jgi:hypothetical protein
MGIGNGHKDRMLLEELMHKIPLGVGEDEVLYYYPVDISIGMLTEGIKHIEEKTADCREKLHVKAVIGDFTELDKHPISAIYSYRERHNVFALLGNTIGSASEVDIMDALKKSMLLGDLLLLEVDTADDFAKHDRVFGDSSRKKQLKPLGVVALEELGFCVPSEFDGEEVSHEQSIGSETPMLPYDKTNTNAVPPLIGEQTRTMIVGYKKARLVKNGAYTHVRFSRIRQYEQNELRDHLRKHLGIEILWPRVAENHQGACFILGKRVEL